jgi:hypothetical protein
MNLSATAALLMAAEIVGNKSTDRIRRKFSGLVPILSSHKYESLNVTQNKEKARRLKQIKNGMIPKNIAHSI